MIQFIRAITLCLLISNLTVAQQISVNSDVCYGGTSNDVAQGFLDLPSGNKIIYGNSNSPVSGTKTSSNYGLSDIWLIMLDADGNEVWQKTYGGTFDDRVSDLILLSTGELLLLGASESSNTGNKTSVSYGSSDVWLLKLDLNGNVLLDKAFGGSGIDTGDKLVEYDNGAIMLFCSSSSGIEGNKTSVNHGILDFWVIKIDSEGQDFQQASFGGDSFDSFFGFTSPSSNEFYFSINSSSSISGNKTEASYGLDDIWILKCDSSLNLQAQKTLGGDQSEYAWSMNVLSNSNLVIAGTSNSGISGVKSEDSYGDEDVWMIELTNTLSVVREKTIGSGLQDAAQASFVNWNNQLVVLTISESNSNSFKTQNSLGGRDYWLFILDQDWNVIHDNTIGSDGNDAPISMKKNANSTIQLLGSSNGNAGIDKTCPGNGGNDIWEVELDSDLSVNVLNSKLLSVFPNPVTSTLFFSGKELSGSWQIYNAAGILVLTGDTKEIDVSILKPGFYSWKMPNETAIRFVKTNE